MTVDNTRAAGTATISPGAPALMVGVSVVRRSGGPFFLGDTAFLSDARFRALARRLPDPDDFNSAVGAWFIALAAARRNGRPQVDVEIETGTKFLPDLMAVGLLIEDGFRKAPFDAWAPMSPQQAAAGKARAASAQRDAAGQFTSALEALDQRVQPSLPIPSNQLPSTEGESVGEETLGVDDQEARVFSFIARFGASIREDSSLGRRLLGLIERRGVEEVLRVAGTLAKANGVMSDRQWVLGLENAIEQIPSARDARREDAAGEQLKRSERIQAEAHARRVERFRFTGEWDDAFGPRPVA